MITKTWKHLLLLQFQNLQKHGLPVETTGQSISLDVESQEAFKIVLVYLINLWRAYQGVSTNPSCLNTRSSTSPILILLLTQLVPSSHIGKGQDKTAALFPRYTFKLLTQERKSGEDYKVMKVADETKEGDFIYHWNNNQ